VEDFDYFAFTEKENYRFGLLSSKLSTDDIDLCRLCLEDLDIPAILR